MALPPTPSYKNDCFSSNHFFPYKTQSSSKKTNISQRTWINPCPPLPPYMFSSPMGNPVSLKTFDHLILLETPLISKKDTKFIRKSIPLNEHLALTLRFLTHPENRKFHYLFNSDWEDLQSQQLFLSALKLFIKVLSDKYLQSSR